MKKLKQQGGETILEVLLALLIAVLCIFFMTESLTTASGINRQSQDSTTGFRYDKSVSMGNNSGEFSITAPELNMTDYPLEGTVRAYNSYLDFETDTTEVHRNSTYYYYAQTGKTE